ncbi:MAG: hypothetical protein ACXWZY_11385 [Gaiellaceae bacterium]
MIRRHFRLKKIALGLAFAAVVVPTAQASVLLDGHPAPVSYTAVAHQPIASEISVQSPVSQLQVEGLRWQAMAKAYEDLPGITAAGAALNNAKHSAYPVSVVQTTTSDSFNWSDAGIGASIAFGAALMLLMAVILGRRFRSRPTGLAST